MKAKADTKDRFVIIMAGGRGERFWPVSREKTPKQLLRLLGKRSFLQEAVDRVLPLVPIKNIFIITNAAQASSSAEPPGTARRSDRKRSSTRRSSASIEVP